MIDSTSATGAGRFVQRSGHPEISSLQRDGALKRRDGRGGRAMVSFRRCGTLLAALCVFGPAMAAAPPADAAAFACSDREGRPVPAIFGTNARHFAVARMLPASEVAMARDRGVSVYVIELNRDIYYLGPATQRWLHQRQCVHIQRQHAIVERGDAALETAQEAMVDCLAAGFLLKATKGASPRVLLTSIEGDMERLTPERWSSVLPGPRRRIALTTCPGLN